MSHKNFLVCDAKSIPDEKYLNWLDAKWFLEIELAVNELVKFDADIKQG